MKKKAQCEISSHCIRQGNYRSLLRVATPLTSQACKRDKYMIRLNSSMFPVIVPLRQMPIRMSTDVLMWLECAAKVGTLTFGGCSLGVDALAPHTRNNAHGRMHKSSY